MKQIVSLRNDQKWELLLAKFHQIAESGQYTEGQFVSEFEQRACRYLHDMPCTALSSAGSVLFAVYSWLYEQGVRAVAIQNNTFYATAAMAFEAGMTVSLIDSRSDDPSMSADSLEAAIQKHGRFEAVCLTHVGGMVARDYEVIAQICDHHKICLIEDCAHTFGIRDGINGVYPGRYGLASVFSFYPTKAVPVGEGGLVASNHLSLMDWLRKFRNYGKSIDDQGVVNYVRGFNLRMDEWSAAVACTQIEVLPKIMDARRRDAEVLSNLIAPMFEGRNTNWYKFIVPAEKAGRFINRAGQVYRRTDQLDMIFKSRVGHPVKLENSYAWAQNHVCLPCGEGMYDQYSIGTVLKYLESE